jgi:hypothetical protein
MAAAATAQEKQRRKETSMIPYHVRGNDSLYSSNPIKVGI